jgi:hypothetical protein
VVSFRGRGTGNNYPCDEGLLRGIGLGIASRSCAFAQVKLNFTQQKRPFCLVPCRRIPGGESCFNRTPGYERRFICNSPGCRRTFFVKRGEKWCIFACFLVVFGTFFARNQGSGSGVGAIGRCELWRGSGPRRVWTGRPGFQPDTNPSALFWKPMSAPSLGSAA